MASICCTAVRNASLTIGPASCSRSRYAFDLIQQLLDVAGIASQPLGEIEQILQLHVRFDFVELLDSDLIQVHGHRCQVCLEVVPFLLPPLLSLHVLGQFLHLPVSASSLLFSSSSICVWSIVVSPKVHSPRS